MPIIPNQININTNFVGSKAKRRISKRVFQDNKARQIWRVLFSWNTRFEIRPSALLPTTSSLPLSGPFLISFAIIDEEWHSCGVPCPLVFLPLHLGPYRPLPRVHTETASGNRVLIERVLLVILLSNYDKLTFLT